MTVLKTILGWVCCLALTAAADPGRRPFIVMGTDQGLTAGAVICMAQDKDGFIWTGSENGLIRYEGGQCRQWSTEDGLPSTSVARLLSAPDGGIWASTMRGLVLFRDGRFLRAQVGGAAYPATAGDICMDRRGRVWATTAEGLIRQQEGVIFETLPWKIQGSTYALTAGPWSGAVYAAGERGIQAFLEDGGTRVWGPADGLPAKGPTLVMEDGKGRLWAGAGRVLVMKEPGAARFKDQSALLEASISPNGQPYLDHDGSVWLPTQDGAQQLGGERLAPARGLPFRWVRTVFRDQEGSLWIVGAAMAHMLGRGQVLNYPFSQGESGEMVWFTVRDGQGRMLAATDNGVMRMGPDGAARIPGTGGWRIKGMVLDRGGTLWMVNTRGPTLWLRPGRTAAEVAPLGDLGMCANSVWEDSRGRIWLGSTNRGVLRWDPAAARLVQEEVPFPASGILGVYELHEDADGRIWAGADSGLLVREAQGGWRLFADKACQRVRGMALLPDGTAWIHTEEALGIAHVRLADGQIQILERRTRGWGLRSNMVYAVRTDPRGHIWVSTDKGLDRVDPPLHVGRHDGMVSEDCSISALRIEGDPERPVVWVGTSSGLVRFEDTGAAVPEAPAPRAHILEVAFGDRRLEPPFGMLPAVPSDQATFDFRVAAPTYQDEQEVRYQVRLLGLEDVWRTLADRHVHFPALPGGAYRFEVRAARFQGPFGPAAALGFTVRPPWWRTWWAYAGATLSVGLLIAALVRMRVGALARSKAALEALVATRTRELSLRNQELSEAMGNVKRLSGLLPICAHCKKIRDDRGYWNQLEQYFSEHAEVGFSHGICPDCASEQFPEITLKRPRT